MSKELENSVVLINSTDSQGALAHWFISCSSFIGSLFANGFYVVSKVIQFVFLGMTSAAISYISYSGASFYLLALCGALLPLLTHLILKSRVFSAYSLLKRDIDDDMFAKNRQMIEDNEAIFMNTSEDKRRSGFASYLDEFLSAIKIFGNLDKLVFHELTKSMRTQRLEQDEVMLLDDSVGFSIVVEGTLQIYHKIATPHENSNSHNGAKPVTDDYQYETTDDDLRVNGERFQLLNKVTAGNHVSSLVSILKLFTDNQAPMTETNGLGAKSPSTECIVDTSFRPSVFPFLDSLQEPQNVDIALTKAYQKYDVSLQNMPNAPTPSYSPVPRHIDDSPISNHSIVEKSSESLPEIVAYASTDCTVAVIPASAFKRLMVKYPRSASHIIQMILTELYRVTFQTAHSYLGLTKEIMYTEVLLNRRVNFELPYYLQDALLKSIQRKSNELPSQENIHRHQRGSARNISQGSTKGSRHIALESRDQFNPGDLLSNVPLSRKDFSCRTTNASSGLSRAQKYSKDNSSTNITLHQGEPHNSNSHHPSISSPSTLSTKTSKINLNENPNSYSFSAAEETEESAWRMALVESIFGYLGITNENIMPPNEDSFLVKHRRTSSASLCSSFASVSQTKSLNQEVFKCLSPEKVKIRKKAQRAKYAEKEPLNLDFNSAKVEFAQGLETMFISSGTILLEQNANSKGLYYIVSGELEVCSKAEEDLVEHVLYTVKPGGIAGYLAAVIGFKSFVSLRAKTDLYVGFVALGVLEKLCDKYFMIYLRIAETLTNLLSPKILKLDYALEWVHLEASETLFKQNDPANAIYVVLNGRLRQLHQRTKTQEPLEEKLSSLRRKKTRKELNKRHVQVIGEYSQGCSFGEVEVITAVNRLSTVVAVRDTELARIPRTLFEVLALEHPSIMIRVSRLVARNILQKHSDSDEPTKIMNNANGYRYDFNLMIPSSVSSSSWGSDSFSWAINYKTITILPITQGLPVEEFATKLVSAFKQVGRTTIGLTQSTTLSHLGRHAFDKLANLKQSGYFTQLEELYEVVVYIADTPINSSWTSTCISQGDCILLLADATSEPDIGEYERLLLKNKTTARTELLLLHPERYVEPGLTHKWLRNRMWVHQHHHMQFVSSQKHSERSEPKSGVNFLNPASVFMERLRQKERLNQLTKKTQENFVKLLPDSIKSTMENISLKYIQRKQKYYTPVYAHKNDFLRLARILSGQAIGLVLGGGGARGISHLGVLKAIEEHGIPIDMIGGTSIGSFVGGLYAKDYDLVPIYGRVKKFAGRIGSLWRMLSDMTWPVTSYTTGHEFNRGIWKSFGDIRIEDFWIQYYCNSTNITESVQEIHSSGYAWRYIRASMSLAGILPPLTDNGSMLLDGGYLDNLPVSEMKSRGCKTIFAVDVGSVDDRTPMEYGDSLNGFWILFNRWNPFSKHPNIPNMAEIQMRLGYVASVNALEKAKSTPGVIYFRPPIEPYATLDFAKFEEIYQVGAAYGRMFFQELEKTGNMPKIPGNEPFSAQGMHLQHRRNSI
ncbi:lysophospholipase Ecym_1163 [Eremothecium cymbalariae DBVPG|uniref:Lysophospholipase NTE1 n=1 Tax=Eremothecium cymbalariae (strain CBS 270.75 / DBVPG 7215 / KCTC 17166 / NRRL Y-17582) TaxID=931890 RepID=G8JMU9_ERECY|nr:hypothetical protein Ecym_1163 [Eremothecium cymbalariae DBVPG\